MLYTIKLGTEAQTSISTTCLESQPVSGTWLLKVQVTPEPTRNLLYFQKKIRKQSSPMHHI